MTTKKDEKMFTPVFRLNWPNLFLPVAGEDGGAEKYSCQAIWTLAEFTPRDKELWKALLAKINELSLKEFDCAWKDLPSTFRPGVRNGKEKPELAGYGEGTMFASLGSKFRPGIQDSEGNFIGPEFNNTHRIYSGCYCKATVNPFAFRWKNKEGKVVSKGISLGLRNLRWIADGKRLDNVTTVDQDFADEVDEGWSARANKEMDDEDQL